MIPKVLCPGWKSRRLDDTTTTTTSCCCSLSLSHCCDTPLWLHWLHCFRSILKYSAHNAETVSGNHRLASSPYLPSLSPIYHRSRSLSPLSLSQSLGQHHFLVAICKPVNRKDLNSLFARISKLIEKKTLNLHNLHSFTQSEAKHEVGDPNQN